MFFCLLKHIQFYFREMQGPHLITEGYLFPELALIILLSRNEVPINILIILGSRRFPVSNSGYFFEIFKKTRVTGYNIGTRHAGQVVGTAPKLFSKQS